MTKVARSVTIDAEQAYAAAQQMRLHLVTKIGSRTKVATKGPIAAPLVFRSVAIPVLFIRSAT